MIFDIEIAVLANIIYIFQQFRHLWVKIQPETDADVGVDTLCIPNF